LIRNCVSPGGVDGIMALEFCVNFNASSASRQRGVSMQWMHPVVCDASIPDWAIDFGLF
jgi:hypothetical protein